MRSVGIDTSKKACQAIILDPAGAVADRLEFENAPSGWDQLAARLTPGDELVVEACTYAYPIHDHFRVGGWTVVAAHPAGNRRIARNESKTDWKDAYDLANLHRTGYLHRAYIPDPSVLKLRDLLRAQIELGQETARCKSRIHAFLARNGVRPPYENEALFTRYGYMWLQVQRFGDERDALLMLRLKELKSLKERRDLMDVQLAKVAVRDARVELLLSLPAFDYYLALVLLAEIGDVHRFADNEAFRRYAGCCPRVRKSAGVDRGGGPVAEFSRNLKWALGLAAPTLAQQANPVHDYYEKMLRRTRNQRRALARARRKVCDLVYAMLTKKQPCRWARAENQTFKLEKMERLSRREIAAQTAE